MKLLFTLPLLTSCSVIRLSSVGPGFATLALVGALVLFFFLVIKPSQDAKNKAKQEAKERAEADALFERDRAEVEEFTYGCFEDTELMASTL